MHRVMNDQLTNTRIAAFRHQPGRDQFARALRASRARRERGKNPVAGQSGPRSRPPSADIARRLERVTSERRTVMAALIALAAISVFTAGIFTGVIAVVSVAIRRRSATSP